MPSAYRGAAAAAELPPPGAHWWREFRSQELDALQEQALGNNRELRVAVARIAQAQAQVRVAEAGLSPSLELFGRGEAESASAAASFRNERRDRSLYELGLRARYEVDLWGKQGYAVESALALATASVHQREVVALTLVADVAATYLEYLSLAERIAIASRSLASRRHSVAAVEKRLAQGDATTVELGLHRIALGVAEADNAILAQRRERALHRLAVLVGVAPAAIRVSAQSLAEVSVPTAAPGLPAKLLCRRPDIRRMEAQLAAARLDVSSVRASMLPSVSLLGEIGYSSRHLSSLVSPASLFALLAGTIGQSLLDGGLKEAQAEVARARHLELLEQYGQLLLTALREVEDALAAVRFTQEQLDALARSHLASTTSYALNQRAFEAGGVDRIALLDLEQKMYAEETAMHAARYDRLRAAIDLYKALGGGMRPGAEELCG